MKKQFLTLAICVVAATSFRGNAQPVAEATIGATISDYGKGGAFVVAGGYHFDNNIRLQGEAIINTDDATPVPFLLSVGVDIHPFNSDLSITPLIGAGYALWSTDGVNDELPNRNTWTGMVGLRFQPVNHLFAQIQITKKAVSAGIGFCWVFNQ